VRPEARFGALNVPPGSVSPVMHTTEASPEPPVLPPVSGRRARRFGARIRRADPDQGGPYQVRRNGSPKSDKEFRISATSALTHSDDQAGFGPKSRPFRPKMRAIGSRIGLAAPMDHGSQVAP
jgi:hypothetical protein